MDIKDFLSPEHALLDVRASDKIGLLRELARRAAAALGVPAGRIADELQKREDLGSTGTGGGLAFPHTRLPEVANPFGMLVSLKRPVDFDAIDGKAVDVVFLLLLPASAAGEQLTALAAVARKLREPHCLQRVRDATTAGELYSAMVE